MLINCNNAAFSALFVCFHIRDLKHDDAFNTTWPPIFSIDKCCQITSLSIERTDHHVLLKASSCLRCLLSIKAVAGPELAIFPLTLIL